MRLEYRPKTLYIGRNGLLVQVHERNKKEKPMIGDDVECHLCGYKVTGTCSRWLKSGFMLINFKITKERIKRK